MTEELSNGQKLLHGKKLTQASCFFAKIVPEEIRLQWSESFSKPALRADKKKFKDSSVFLVLSQNCDIACRNDGIESTIEIAVCKKIREKDVFSGNSFVKSVRKLHFKAGEFWYEANVDYILHVDKAELLNLLDRTENFEPITLANEYAISVPVWRSNRYMRSALPDNFNAQLDPIIGSHLSDIESAATPQDVKQTKFSSYIRAFYVWVNSTEELDSYSFEFFALLRDEVNDEQASRIQTAIENMAEAFEEEAGYKDVSEIYAGRENTTYVSYLTRLVRLNLDHQSLSQGDEDTGPAPV
ncbi:hypothetical protein [Shewanella chilikensis]|uniref:hypothetical protein n=1 Tax=Shewanella chilikensis TaxID=558541 RepID=UPI00300453BE